MQSFRKSLAVALGVRPSRYVANEKQRWVTIGADEGEGGTPVRIDGEGKITAGPGALAGKTIGELDQGKKGTPQDKRGSNYDPKTGKFTSKPKTEPDKKPEAEQPKNTVKEEIPGAESDTATISGVFTLEKSGRRIYIDGPTYDHRQKIKDMGGKWDPEERKWWVSSQKLDRIEKLSRSIAEKKEKRRQYVQSAKDAGNFVSIPFNASAIREKAKKLGAVWNKDAKQWMFRDPKNAEQITKLVEEYKSANKKKGDRVASDPQKKYLRALVSRMTEQDWFDAFDGPRLYIKDIDGLSAKQASAWINELKEATDRSTYSWSRVGMSERKAMKVERYSAAIAEVCLCENGVDLSAYDDFHEWQWSSYGPSSSSFHYSLASAIGVSLVGRYKESGTKPGEDGNPDGAVWRSVAGGGPALIDVSTGQILAACPGLEGEDVNFIGEDETFESKKRRKEKQEQAEEDGWESEKTKEARAAWKEAAGRAPEADLVLIKVGDSYWAFEESAKMMRDRIGIGDGEAVEIAGATKDNIADMAGRLGFRLAVGSTADRDIKEIGGDGPSDKDLDKMAR